MHISPNPQFNSALVAADRDIVILRTFSKVYGMAAAGASLQVKGLVEERRKIIGDIREDVFGYLQKRTSLRAI
jgi:histidinol-phosphate aminotransferase